MTAAQRTNAKYDRIWETYKAQEKAKELSKALNAVPGVIEESDREWARGEISDLELPDSKEVPNA